MKKKLFTTFFVATLVAVGGAFPSTENKAEAYDVVAPGEEIASYTMSASIAKDVANNLEMIDGEVRNYGTILSGAFGKASIPVAVLYNASISAQIKNYEIFQNAANQNRGVKVSIIAGPTPNLNTTEFSLR
ncbi:hypothetical protein JCM19045_229 [Bacillus sp. JCM 19045]|nr:hypothetical protein JCM19045_229 [Bacillus sp. JCM 19045]